MQGDGPVLRQSQRHADYQAALAQLAAHVYPCSCSRREIADSQTHHNALDGALVYAGTCRHGAAAGKAALAWRVRVPDAADSAGDICFTDRWQGPLQQRLATEIGDFVLRRADGVWAYQLAVVVDDAAQGVTHVVRGADLLGSTARQIHLQRLLGVPTPCYLHVPLLCGADGSKLSKQNHASALDLQQPLQTLLAAARFLGLQLGPVSTLTGFWQQTVAAWRLRDAAVSSSWQR
jgi:glutamyl-Q tRNA(Asp) synthetase